MSDAKSLQFVDTNILIYAHDSSAGAKQRIAGELLTSLWSESIGCVSVQVLQEFFVNATRRIGNPLKPEAAAQLISDYASWRVHVPGAQDLLDAIQRHLAHRISFWDAMIITSASALDCEILWSEDLNHGQRFDSLVVRNPFV
jgi:predicted nucleic acid-binding protein